MKRIGLTGGIGSGKTTVARILEAMGYPVFYSDEHSKTLMSNPEVQSHINAILGEDVFPHGQLDRVAMAGIIFSDSKKREAVNEFLHPKVRSDFDIWANEQKAALLFNEAAILFETGAYQRMDLNILVIAPIELRIARTIQRDGINKEAVLDRISKQATDEEKIPLADFVLHNDDEHPVLAQVEDILVKILGV